MLLVCPDLQAAAEMVAQDRLFDVAYAGIRPYDIIFSHQGLVAQGRAQGHTWMEHNAKRSRDAGACTRAFSDWVDAALLTVDL